MEKSKEIKETILRNLAYQIMLDEYSVSLKEAKIPKDGTKEAIAQKKVEIDSIKSRLNDSKELYEHINKN